MDSQVKNIMLNMYPKSQISEEVEVENGVVEQHFQHPVMMMENKGNDELKKWAYAGLIGALSVFLFSSFFLDMVDELCMRRDATVFNSSGDPKVTLIIVIFTIILLITRTFFSLI